MNNSLMVFGFGVMIGSMFKGIVVVGLVLSMLGAVGYFWVKRSKLISFFKKA